tara:strand:- start:26672 stop:26860 length:189 start_codon:yes stop_codon:yes gene_type:complete
MSKQDKVAFLVSSILVMLGLFITAEEGPAGLVLCAPVVLYWLYRYLSGDISFIGKTSDQEEQ